MNTIRERLSRLDFSLSVEKPNRYCGNEYNPVFSPPADPHTVRFLLCYPDVYEVGISNQSIAILYALLNKNAGASAERAYGLWPDMETFMRREKIPLFSLETQTPATCFDIIGFTLQYELTYTNIFTMLDLSGIPLHAQARKEGPIVAAGGPCAFNPLPLSPFIDIFYIGDGEESILQTAKILARHKRSGTEADRKKLLSAIADKVRGVYVPSLHGAGETGLPHTVKKATVQNLDTSIQFPAIVPSMQGIHNRLSVEIMRGCPNSCRFCQAAMIYRPLRPKSRAVIEKTIVKGTAETGFDDIGLLSLSASDYPDLHQLLGNLSNHFTGTKTRISLPSLRVDSLDKETLARLSQVKHTGLTLAPETGTEALRLRLHKNVTDSQFFQIMAKASNMGWNLVKLYFMIGLPCENNDDIDALPAFVRRARTFLKQGGHKPLKFKVSVSPFVPKPHTTFQWAAMNSLDVLQEKIAWLRTEFRSMGYTTFKYADPEQRVIECCFARGDTAMAAVLESAWRSGIRFDGWDELFDYERWLDCFKKNGISPDNYTSPFPCEKPLPWDFIHTAVPKNHIVKMWQDYTSAEE